MSSRLRLLSAGIAGLLLSAISLVAQVPAGAYDVVIRNGRVLDGMGNPWIARRRRHQGRALREDRARRRARRARDRCAGRYVSPGWIDMMDQSGGVLPRNGLAENKLRMGVTTAIGGEGGTPVPAAQVPTTSRRSSGQGISINFGSYYSETQARIAGAGPYRARTDRRRAGAHAGD